MQYLLTEEEYAKIQIDKAAIRREIKAELKAKLKPHQEKCLEMLRIQMSNGNIMLRSRENGAHEELLSSLYNITDIDWADEAPAEKKEAKAPPIGWDTWQDYSDSLRRAEHSAHFNKP